MTDTEKKAIEEMADIISSKINGANFDDVSDAVVALYDAGYRKQRTAEWVTTAETEDGVIVRYTHQCTGCNYFCKTVCPRGDDHCHKCGAKMSRKE